MGTSVIERLEARRLLSANFSESEPNNSRARADAVPRLLGEDIEVRGNISTLGDRDWFKIDLKAGDVLAVSVRSTSALDTAVGLFDAAGRLLMANDDSNQGGVRWLPEESPLPRSTVDFDAEIYRVMPRAGTYFIQVAASEFIDLDPVNKVGKYEIDLMVARPGLQGERVGTKQILFLDFDGATVDYSEFGNAPSGVFTLSPMADFVTGWNLTADDYDALIDATVARVKQLLSRDVERRGLNGDYDRTHRPGDFDIEIRNSRDHADTYGTNPFVSRVVIGGTAEEAGLVGDYDVIGTAETQDVGNFKTDDQAVATLSWLTDGIPFVSAVAPFTQVDLLAEGMAVLAAHEAGHIFGNFHTDPAEGGRTNLMDSGIIFQTLGPDFVMGTEDDPHVRLGVDDYWVEGDLYEGTNDTLNTVAFGLSTGTVRRHCGADDDDHDRRFRGSFDASGRGSDSAWERLLSMSDEGVEWALV